MTFAKRIYTIAGIFGILVIAPMYFMEDRVGRDFPPVVNHPEFFYGFIGVGLAFQFAFLVIGRDPVRFRPMMPVSWLEKFPFAIACLVLFLKGRLAAPTL